MFIIATPSLIPHDAVGNDVRGQHKALLDSGVEACIFCESFKEDFYSRPYLIEREELQRHLKDPSVTLIYHHSIYWELGLNFLKQARCRIFVKYHNITPPEFFAPYNSYYAHICYLGRLQTKEIVSLHNIKFFADSQYNAEELISLGAKKVFILPPFHNLDDFDRQTLHLPLAEKLNDGRFHVLFVGRFVPNKGHRHLIEVLRRYIAFYDSNVVFHIVGFLDPGLKSYHDEIFHLLSLTKLQNYFLIHGKVSFTELYTFYSCSHVFLLLSDHEGFCVPILEAQKLYLPIVAHSASAIPETLGENQLIFLPGDYVKLACALGVLKKNPSYRLYLAQEGQKNLARFSLSILKRKFLSLTLSNDPHW